jgi:hypothetical protein
VCIVTAPKSTGALRAIDRTLNPDAAVTYYSKGSVSVYDSRVTGFSIRRHRRL